MLNCLNENSPILTNQLTTIIGIIIPAISSLAALISCILLYKTTRPNIKLRIRQNNNSNATANLFISIPNLSVAIVLVEIVNKGNTAGMIDDVSITFKKNKYAALSESAEYDISKFISIKETTTGVKVNARKQQLTMPVTVAPYSFVGGYFVFPNFTATNSTVKVRLSYRQAYSNFKRIKIRKITLFNAVSYNLINSPNANSNT